MKILLTNDDGVEAPGLKALVDALEGAHEILVAAPAKEKSASSHAISLGQKLVIETLDARRYAIHGTPADCVKFALSEIKDFKPDLVISGINPGPNTGVSVYYSGTISAAREALINRVPAIAVSVQRRGAPAPAWPAGRCRSGRVSDFSFAASFTQSLIQGYEEKVFPRDVVLNVNIPNLPESEIRGIKIARQAASRFIEEFVQENASRREKIYRLAGEIQIFDPDGTTDDEVLSQGFIAITPLKLDVTDYEAIPILEKWLERKEALWPSPKPI